MEAFQPHRFRTASVTWRYRSRTTSCRVVLLKRYDGRHSDGVDFTWSCHQLRHSLSYLQA